MRPPGTRVPWLARLFGSDRGAPDAIPAVTDGPITAQLIRDCVGTESPTILDIGANKGTQSLWLAEMFDDARVFSFEPDPRAITRFKETVGDHPDVTLFELALSDRDGTITFHQSGGHHDPDLAAEMPEGWDLSGSIRAPKEHLDAHPWVTFEETVEVATTTLDSWCADQGVDAIDFIWMDVQGAEIDVFRGGVAALARTRYVYTEYSDRELYEGQRPLADLLDHLGRFRVVTRYPTDVLLENTSLRRSPPPT